MAHHKVYKVSAKIYSPDRDPYTPDYDYRYDCTLDYAEACQSAEKFKTGYGECLSCEIGLSRFRDIYDPLPSGVEKGKVRIGDTVEYSNGTYKIVPVRRLVDLGIMRRSRDSYSKWEWVDYEEYDSTLKYSYEIVHGDIAIEKIK